MKNLILSLLLLVSSFGCASWQDTSGKTLASTAATVDAAMKGWAVYVVNNNVTNQDQLSVKQAYQRYQYAMSAASNAYVASVQAKDKSLFTASVAVLLAAKNDIVNLVRSFSNNQVIVAQ